MRMRFPIGLVFLCAATGGVVLVDGHLYGFSNSILTCMNFETGQTRWKNRSVGKGSLTWADGDLYVLSENNVVGLVEANPAEYVEKGRPGGGDRAPRFLLTF